MQNRTLNNYITILTLLASPAHAKIITDGSLGARVTLPGNEMQITPDLGQQLGSNLFHSFQSFNLNAGESATFSGANNIQNIIARVTGGSPSLIDGTLRSTIPNADLYFLNPYGVMFGQHAKLDLQGGFHVSTADYLRLADGGRFEARNLSNSLLTLAPVTAFGFLTDTPATIQTQDSRLSIPKGETFSWIGGELEFYGRVPPVYGKDTSQSAGLFAESGRLDLVSVASTGEVIPTPEGFDLQSFTKLGTLSLTNNLMSVSGVDGNGKVFIRGGLFQMSNGWIENNNSGTPAGGTTDVHVENMTLTEKAGIDTSTLGFGDGGSANFAVTDTLNLLNGGNLHVNTTSSSPQAGKGERLTIQAHQINLTNGGNIASATFGAGQAGSVIIKAQNISVHMGSISSYTTGSGRITGQAGSVTIEAQNISAKGSSIASYTSNSSHAGSVTIKADNFDLMNGSYINSATFGSGRGGTVVIDLSGTLMISGENATGYRSGVFASSQDNKLENAGDAGSITIHARRVVMSEGGVIRGTTLGTGHGGTIDLHIAESLTISGQSRAGMPSMISSSSTEEAEVRVGGTTLKEGLQHGNAGSLFIQVPIINILDGAEISARANRSGGGNIELIASQLIYLRHAQLTTSVKGGLGNGGNLTLNHPNFIVLNHGQIKAEADAGHGGNIAIAADNFVKSVDSLISASSKLGVDGQITIDSPAEDIGSQVLNLSASFLNAAGLFPRSCAARIADQRPSEFVRPFTLTVKPKAISAAPEDLQASHLR